MRLIILTFILILTAAVPALAETPAERHAMAELISARIKSALAGEAYTLDQKTCNTADCTVSIRQ